MPASASVPGNRCRVAVKRDHDARVADGTCETALRLTTGGDQQRGVGVPRLMQRQRLDLPERLLGPRVVHRLPRLACPQHQAVVVERPLAVGPEHQPVVPSAGKPVRGHPPAQPRLDRQRPPARPALGRDLALPSIPRAAHPDHAAVEINVFPAERLDLAEPQPGVERDCPHRRVVVAQRIEENRCLHGCREPGHGDPGRRGACRRA